MRENLRVEFMKAFHSKYFAVTLAVAAALAVWSSVHSIQYYFHTQNMLNTVGINKNPDLAADTLYNHWMGGEFGSFPTDLYYLLLPLLAVFPYAWSLFDERKSGYRKNMVTRCGRKTYIVSKYISTFAVGGLTVLLPLVLNVILIACVVPARTPDPSLHVNYAVYGDSLLSGLFYSSPLLYVLFYLLLPFAFGGLWAATTMAASFFFRNRYAALLVPYNLLLIIQYLTQSFFAWHIYLEASPINYVRGVMMNDKSAGWVIALEFLLLFAFSFGTSLYRGLRDDVF